MSATLTRWLKHPVSLPLPLTVLLPLRENAFGPQAMTCT